ncbi:hypothetical protein D3C81_1313470 [compost metagenome]
MAASAVRRQASLASWRTASSGLLTTPRNNTGKAMHADTSDSRITPAAMKISKSRSGNALPALINNGTDMTPARVTAPRTPPMVSSQQERALGTSTRSSLPRQRRITPIKRQMLCTQTKRNITSTAKIATTSRQRHSRVGHNDAS